LPCRGNPQRVTISGKANIIGMTKFEVAQRCSYGAIHT